MEHRGGRAAAALLGLAATLWLSGCGGDGGGGTGPTAGTPAPAPSATATPSLAQTAAPALAAIPNVGRTATVTTGAYVGAVNVTGQWFADGVAIAGATATTYRIVAADDGKRLSYTETANAPGATALTTTVTAPVPVMPALAGPLLAEGDSALEGVGASSPAANWISQFAAAHDLTLVNRGVAGFGLESEYSGETVSNLRLSQDAQAAPHFGTVVIAIGGNDVFQSSTNAALTPANFAAQLRERLAQLRISHYAPTDIVLASLYPIGDAVLPYFGVTRARYAAFNAVIRPIAEEYGVRFIDFYSLGGGVGDPADISADNLHPNDLGYAALYRFAAYATVIPNRRALPTAVVAVGLGGSQIRVSWSAAAGMPAGYTVERVVAGSYAFGGTTDLTDTTDTAVTLAGVAPGYYFVRVRARFADGSVGPWAFASDVTQAP